MWSWINRYGLFILLCSVWISVRSSPSSRPSDTLPWTNPSPRGQSHHRLWRRNRRYLLFIVIYGVLESMSIGTTGVILFLNPTAPAWLLDYFPDSAPKTDRILRRANCSTASRWPGGLIRLARPPTEGFKLYRDGVFMALLDSKTLNYNDFNVIAGRPYTYEVPWH